MRSSNSLFIGALAVSIVLLGVPFGAQAGDHGEAVTNRPVMSAGPTNGRGPKGGVTITTGLPPGGGQGGLNGAHGGGIGQGSNRGTYNYPGGTVHDHRSH
jgi:hypothetical protein